MVIGKSLQKKLLPAYVAHDYRHVGYGHGSIIIQNSELFARCMAWDRA